MFSKLVTFAAVFSAVVVEANITDSTEKCGKVKECCVYPDGEEEYFDNAPTCTTDGGSIRCCSGSGRRRQGVSGMEESVNVSADTQCGQGKKCRRLEMRLGELAAVHEVEEADEEDRRRNVSSSTQGCDPKSKDDSGRYVDCIHLPGKPNCLETSRATLSKLCPDSMGCMDDLKFSCQA